VSDIKEALDGLEFETQELADNWGTLTGHDIIHLWFPAVSEHLKAVREWVAAQQNITRAWKDTVGVIGEKDAEIAQLRKRIVELEGGGG